MSKRERMKSITMISMAILLIASVTVNLFLYYKPDDVAPEAIPSVELGSNELAYYSSNDSLTFGNANSRETYFTIHNIKKAYAYGKGKGVKVGVLDWGFAPDGHEELYSGYKRFNSGINEHSEHGFWMATTLREIAPECEIYAIDVFDWENEDKWVGNMVNAIDWAIENKLDILTLSHQEVSEKNAERFSEAIDKAAAYNIVTTFIHNSNPNNILPGGLNNDGAYGQRWMLKKPDVNIFRYDYNAIFSLQTAPGREGLYASYSSTSPVTGGFIAILKSINNSLSPMEYKDILVKTSYKLMVRDDNLSINSEEADHVADIAAAAKYIKENY